MEIIDDTVIIKEAGDVFELLFANNCSTNNAQERKYHQ